MFGYFTAGRKSGVGIMLAVLALATWPGSQLQGSDTPVTLTDLTSTVQVYSQSDAGIASWTVNGVNQLNRQWFWYRVGTTLPGNPEKSLDTLPCTLTPLDSNANPGYDKLTQEFTKAGQFKVTLNYTLTGTTDGASDLGLQITITNIGSTSLNFHFFQLSDFNLGGSSSQDTAQVPSSTHGYAEALQQNGGLSLDTTFSPGGAYAQVGLHPAVYNLLTDTTGNVLTNTLGPTALGDAEWAMQWDKSIAANGTYTITEDQGMVSVVPEPATLCLLTLGGLALLRRKKN